MRILKLNLIIAAMLMLGVSSAGAYSVSMSSASDLGSAGSPLVASDTVTVTVKFDSQGALNVNNRLMALGIGVLFDPGILAYDMMASSVAEFAIGGPTVTGADLVPASTCPAIATYPSYVYSCGLFAFAPPQVQLDFLSSSIGTNVGVSANTAAGGNVIATLVFHVIGAGDGLGEIGFIFTGARGGTLGVQSRPNTSTPYTTSEQPLTLGGGLAVITPEPTTAVLIGLGLAGLGIAGRRRE